MQSEGPVDSADDPVPVPDADAVDTDTVEAPTPPRRSRRAPVVLAWFAGFLAFVVGLAALFAVAARTSSGDEGYLAYVIPSGPPVAVVTDQPETVPPSTASAVVGSIAVIALSLPNSEMAGILFATADALGLDPLEARAVRTTQTWSFADGTPRANIGVYLLLDSGYANVAYFSTDGARAPIYYSPSVTLLPADLTAGSRVEVESLVNFLDPVTVTTTVLDDQVVAPPPGFIGDASTCINVRSVFAQEFADPSLEGYVIDQVDAWCAGRGTVASRSDSPFGIINALVVDAAEVTWPEVLVSEPVTRLPGTQLRSPMLNNQFLRPPVSVPAGILAVNDTLGDLVVLTARDLGADDLGLNSTVAWMQHPGGAVLGFTADDDLIAVTTSQRTLQAYDGVGRLRWSIPLPDVAVGAPVIVGQTISAALVDGSLRGFDAGSGRQLWSLRFPDIVSQAPVGNGDVVLGLDSEGRTLIVDSAGSVVASGELGPITEPVSALADGSFLVAHSNGSLTLLDAGGEERWSTTLASGSVNATAQLWGDLVAVPTSGGLLGLDAATGDTRWVLPQFTRSSLGPMGLLGQGGEVIRVDGDGRTELLAELRDLDNAVPLYTFITRLGGEWVAVSSGGTIHYLGIADE